MSVKQGGNTIAGGGSVDQTYDGTSTNAQSGTAVAGAISNMVTTDTAQTISGQKTFSQPVLIMNGENANAELRWDKIEFVPLTTNNFGGFIDFHYAGSTADYTSRIIENSSGNINFDCTSVTAPATTVANGVVTTTGINKSTDGYVKLGNGLIIQKGVHTVSSSGSSTLTFPTAFGNTDWQMGVCRLAGSTTTNESGSFYVRGKTTTTASIYVTSSTRSIMWIAIGY